LNPRRLLFALLLTGAAVQAAEEGNSREPIGSLAIVNVHMLGSESGAADVLVNVLILDGKLKIVTENEIPPGTVKMTVDGQEGYLFGSLSIGALPQFVILDEDPRVDIDVLLDTAKHAVFALKSGVVVLNELPTLLEPDAELPETRGWQAYTAPPIALPLRYYGGRKWNRFETRWVSGLVNGALVLDRLEWISQDEESREPAVNKYLPFFERP
jgi:phosphate-selective porin OprO/OprP